MPNENIHYYLSQVLGIQSVALPRQQFDEKVKVVFYSDSVLSPQAAELLKKMIGAMKLKDTDIRLATNRSDVGECQYLVNFSNQIIPNLECQQILTESPEILLQRPESKKKVWVDLQKVMRYLQIS